MVTATTILFGILTVHYVLGMPNDNDDIRKLLELENDEPKLNDKRHSIIETDEHVENKRVQGQRQKRWYGPSPYDYPPFARPYSRESDLESSLSLIRSNLDLILNLAKSPPPPPPPTIYPVYIPVYIPQQVCGCNPAPAEKTPTKSPETPTKSPETPATDQNPTQETIPELFDRYPEMIDDRQNWGLLINNTVADYDDDDDGSRPISLGPISNADDGGPSVEHGSSQADANDPATSDAINPPREVASSVNSQRNCDNAVLSCCLGPDKNYECVQSRGCSDETLRQNPCNTQKLLATITRLQSYYS